MKATFKRVLSTVLALCVLLASATCLMGMTASAETTPSASTDTTVFEYVDALQDQYIRFGGCGQSGNYKGLPDVLWGQDVGETIRITLDYYNPDGGSYEIRKNATGGNWDYGTSTLTFSEGLGSMDVSWEATSGNGSAGCVEPMIHSVVNNSGKTLYIWNIHIWAHHYKNGEWHDVEFSGDEITHLYPATADSILSETTLDKVPFGTVKSPKVFSVFGSDSGAEKYYFHLKGAKYLQDASWGVTEGDTVRVKFDYYNVGNNRWALQPYISGYSTGYTTGNIDGRAPRGYGSVDVSWTATKSGTASLAPVIDQNYQEGYYTYIWNIEITIDFKGETKTYTSEGGDIDYITANTAGTNYPANLNYSTAPFVYQWTGNASPLKFYGAYYTSWNTAYKTLNNVITNAAVNDEVEISFDYYLDDFASGCEYQLTTDDSSVAKFDHTANLTAGLGSFSETFNVTTAGALLPVIKYTGDSTSNLYIWNIKLSHNGKAYSTGVRATDIGNQGWGVAESGATTTLANLSLNVQTDYMTEISFADDASGEITTTFAPVKLANGVDYTLTFDYFMSSDMDDCYIDGIDTKLIAGKNTYTGTITGTGEKEYITLVTNSENYPSKLYIYNMKLTSEYGTLSFGEHAEISIGAGATYSRVFVDDFWFKADDTLSAGDEIVDTEPTDVPLDITPGSKVFAVPGSTGSGTAAQIRFGGHTAFGQNAFSRGLTDFCYGTAEVGETVRIKFDYYNPDGAAYCISNLTRANTTHETKADVWLGKGLGSMDIEYEVKTQVANASYAPILEFNADNTGKTTYFWNIEVWVTRYEDGKPAEYHFTSQDGHIEYLYKGSNAMYITTDCWHATPYEEVPFVNTWAPEKKNENLVFYGSKWKTNQYAADTNTFKLIVPSTSVNETVEISFDYYINNPAADGKYVLTTEDGTATFDRAVNLSAGKGSVSETFTITKAGALQPVIKYIGNIYSDISIWNLKVSYNGKAYPASFNGLDASSFDDTTIYEQLDYMTEISFADDATGEQSASMKPITLADEEYTLSFNYFLSGNIDNLYVDGNENVKLVPGKNTYSAKVVGNGSDFTFKIVGDSDAYPAKLYVSSITVTSDTDTRNFGAKAVWGVADQDAVSTKTLYYDEEWFTMNHLDSSLVFGDANWDGEVDVLDLVYASKSGSTYKDMRAVDFDKSFKIDEGDISGIRGSVLGIEEKRVIVLTDTHLSSTEWYGISSEERMERLIAQLKEYDKRNPFDEIIVLGDISLDYAGGNGSLENGGTVNDSKNFIDNYLKQLGKTYYILPGNHEQHDNDTWKGFVGEDRQFSFVSGGYLFIACDTFYSAEGYDWAYTPVDVDFVKEEMAKYPDLPVVILAHGFKMESESAEFKELLKTEDRIVGMFQGHDHLAWVETLGEDLGNLSIYHSGQYAYTDGNPYDIRWGFCDVILGENGISIKYVQPSNTMLVPPEAYPDSVYADRNNFAKIRFPYEEIVEFFMSK